MTNDLIYVYCVTNSPPNLVGATEFEGLKSLKLEDFYVIIKPVSESDFSEENFKRNLSDIEWLETHARAHILVINSIMATNTVIPFKFGTIFQSEANLRKFITDYSASLINNFGIIEGKEEWTIKMYCDRKTLSEQIDELSEDAATLEKQILASSPGKAFLLNRKKIELIESELDRLCKVYGQEGYDEFRYISESAGLNNLLPKEFTGREDTMILNSVFLVKKEKVRELKERIEQLTKKHENTGFFIEATGPWPPFSFISIKENR